jgi:hypothetical protein
MLGASLAAPASADCTCRGPGFIAHHGETVCLKTAMGLRLARCEMSLNNASWTILPDPCPEASRSVERKLAADMSFAPAAGPVLR